MSLPDGIGPRVAKGYANAPWRWALLVSQLALIMGNLGAFDSWRDMPEVGEAFAVRARAAGLA